MIAAGFLLLVAAAAWFSALPVFILPIYLVLSAMTFGAYARDKSAAQKGAWRTPENTLHLLALLGGWPGALIAQNRLRHKTKKQTFRIVFWITVVMNCAALIWLLIQGGAAR